jgi:hypothetical protein
MGYGREYAHPASCNTLSGVLCSARYAMISSSCSGPGDQEPLPQEARELAKETLIIGHADHNQHGILSEQGYLARNLVRGYRLATPFSEQALCECLAGFR